MSGLSFTFANNSVETLPLEVDSTNLTLIENEGVSYDLKIKKLDFLFATCKGEIDLINGSTGEVVGTVVITFDVSGGSAASQQSACEWGVRVITAILTAGIK